MALSTDVQTGRLGGLVVNGITKAAIPVKVVIYPDFPRLADLPGGADTSGALIAGFDPAVPLVTIADTSAAADTSASLWGYVTDGTGQYQITVIGDGPEINPSKFTYRQVVTSVDGTVSYYDGSVNVPAGQTIWLSALPVKTSASAGSNKTTVNLTVTGGGGGTGGPITADQITDATDYAVTLLQTVDSPDGLRASIGASNVVVGTGPTDAKAGDYQPAAANISDANTFSRSILTGVTDAASLRTKAGAGTAGSQVFAATDANAILAILGLADAAARLTAAEAAVATSTLTIIESAGAYDVPVGNVRPIIFVGVDNPGALMDAAKDVWLATA